MDVRFVLTELARIDALRYEAVALPFFEDERPLRGAAGLCDWRLCGRLSAILRGGRVTGALGELTLLPARPRLPSRQDVPLSVNVTAPWSDLPGILFTTALNENVPYHLDGTAHVGAGRFTLDVPFAVDSTMPRSVLTGAVSNSVPSLPSLGP